MMSKEVKKGMQVVIIANGAVGLVKGEASVFLRDEKMFLLKCADGSIHGYYRDEIEPLSGEKNE